LLASSSSMTRSVSESKRRLRPSRYDAFARWTKAEEMWPS
jgi:hypothetical protein